MCWAVKNHTERKLALGGDTPEIVVGITKKTGCKPTHLQNVTDCEGNGHEVIDA